MKRENIEKYLEKEANNLRVDLEEAISVVLFRAMRDYCATFATDLYPEERKIFVDLVKKTVKEIL